MTNFRGESMNELEKIAEQEKKLKEKKKQAYKKQYEKIGRAFYKQSKSKSFDEANALAKSFSLVEKSEPTTTISEQDFAELRRMADALNWQEHGQYWRTNDVKELTRFLATFRTKFN